VSWIVVSLVALACSLSGLAAERDGPTERPATIGPLSTLPEAAAGLPPDCHARDPGIPEVAYREHGFDDRPCKLTT